MTDAVYGGTIVLQVQERCNIYREDLMRHKINFTHTASFFVLCTSFSKYPVFYIFIFGQRA